MGGEPLICAVASGRVKMTQKVPTIVHFAGVRQLAQYIFSFDQVQKDFLAIRHFAIINQLVHKSDRPHFSHQR